MKKLKITIDDDIITIKSKGKKTLFQGYSVEEAVKEFVECEKGDANGR